MKVKIEKPANLAKAIEIISDIVTEVKINVNEFGMSINAIDPSNVSMVSFKLPKSAFTEFETDSEVLGVNIDDLKKILKRCGVRSVLTLEKVENQLQIDIQDRIQRNFSLNLIEIDSEDKQMPELQYTTIVTIDSEDFISCIEDAVVVSDACSFETANEKFIIQAKDTNSAKSEFDPSIAQIEGESACSRYSLDFLQKFLKAAKISPKTKINFASNHPLRLDFTQDHMEISFILAPRVENN